MAEKKDVKKKKKGKKKKPIEKRQFNRDLQVNLTDREVRESGDALARNLDELKAIDARRKDVIEQLKADAASCEAEIVRLTNLVRNKYEFKAVRCEETKNFKKGTLTIKRLDTKKNIVSRKLRPEEKQMKLGLEMEDGPEKDKAESLRIARS